MCPVCIVLTLLLLLFFAKIQNDSGPFLSYSGENHRGCNNWWPIFPSIESEAAHASWCKKKGSRVTDVHLARLRLLSE